MLGRQRAATGPGCWARGTCVLALPGWNRVTDTQCLVSAGLGVLEISPQTLTTHAGHWQMAQVSSSIPGLRHRPLTGWRFGPRRPWRELSGGSKMPSALCVAKPPSCTQAHGSRWCVRRRVSSRTRLLSVDLLPPHWLPCDSAWCRRGGGGSVPPTERAALQVWD